MAQESATHKCWRSSHCSETTEKELQRQQRPRTYMHPTTWRLHEAPCRVAALLLNLRQEDSVSLLLPRQRVLPSLSLLPTLNRLIDRSFLIKHNITMAFTYTLTRSKQQKGFTNEGRPAAYPNLNQSVCALLAHGQHCGPRQAWPAKELHTINCLCFHQWHRLLHLGVICCKAAHKYGLPEGPCNDICVQLLLHHTAQRVRGGSAIPLEERDFHILGVGNCGTPF
ncbi:hypothetical protein SELMODRAFT_407353 [Selaginella moellendorffii]|uniref:Uncharacterized protein n=1 Tax=Selaginella moellendorffii TaxID=88036 RepID=D8R4S0_SELML|nr:hypothetical protein SELMODRAFT_407353 [Selaginella moellendorffii]